MSYSGEPNAHALCHCLDCRKISGSSYSNNVIVPEANFKLESGMRSPSSNTIRTRPDNVAGKPKEISKTADTGKNIISHFCADCGTTLFRTGDSFPQAVIIKAGILDDPEWPNQNIPKVELFAPERVKWTSALEGAAQLPGMPPA